jgi:catalase
VTGAVQRKEIERTNNYGQAGERYRSFEQWERDELITNLVVALRQCNSDIQERMVTEFSRCDAEYGERVAEGIGLRVPEPMATGDD